MSDKINKSLLELYDKYEGDLGLLDERWADKRDRGQITSEQSMILSSYVELLDSVEGAFLSDELRVSMREEMKRLEGDIDDDVVAILKARADEK